MQPIVTDVEWSLCLFVGHNQQNQSRCHLGGLKEWKLVLGGACIPRGKRYFLGWGISQPIVKLREYQACSRYSRPYSTNGIKQPFAVNSATTR